MPTPPKPAERRQRRNKPAEIDSQVVAINTMTVPKAPKGISKELAKEWRELFKQPIAATFRPEHVPALTRLFQLKNQVAVCEFEGWQEPLKAGSKGQEQLNPLLKHSKEMRAEILALEDRFGLNSMAAMRLGIATGEAHRSLDEMNTRISKAVQQGGEPNERADPRLNVIDITSS